MKVGFANASDSVQFKRKQQGYEQMKLYPEALLLFETNTTIMFLQSLVCFFFCIYCVLFCLYCRFLCALCNFHQGHYLFMFDYVRDI